MARRELRRKITATVLTVTALCCLLGCLLYPSGSLSIEKLEAMTAVCSVGIDMVVIPGETSDAVISALIAAEAAIGMVNSKTTAVRVIPAVGKKPRCL